MKVFLKTSLAAAILAVGVFSGCDLKVRTRQEPTVYYTQQENNGYWVHEGRVYEREGPENFYLFEGERRGPQILDSNIRIKIQREGKPFRNFREADRNRHDNQRHH
jgi:hypothetical protein